MKKMIILGMTAALFFCLVGPTVVLSAPCASSDPSLCPPDSDTSSSTGGAGAITLDNPLGRGNDDPRVIIGNVIKTVLGIVGSIALVLFIYGGLMMMTSGGNADRVTKGRNTLVWATIGLLVIFSSYTIVAYLLAKISQR